MFYRPKPVILEGLTWAELNKDCLYSLQAVNETFNIHHSCFEKAGRGDGKWCTKHLVLFGELVLSSSCCSALRPVPLLCQCSPTSLLLWLFSSSGLKAWKQDLLCSPNSHCTHTISQELPRVEFYLGLEILNHRKLLNVAEVDSVTGGCTDGDWWETARLEEEFLHPWKTRAQAAQNCMLCFCNKAV